jgi:hypothetical protein
MTEINTELLRGTVEATGLEFRVHTSQPATLADMLAIASLIQAAAAKVGAEIPPTAAEKP